MAVKTAVRTITKLSEGEPRQDQLVRPRSNANGPPAAATPERSVIPLKLEARSQSDGPAGPQVTPPASGQMTPSDSICF